MAKQILTAEHSFREIPRIGRTLLRVEEGIDADLALTDAIFLLDAIKALANHGVAVDMEASISWLIEFAADAAMALLHSIEPGVERGSPSVAAREMHS
jgi:hypothetical protein